MPKRYLKVPFDPTRVQERNHWKWFGSPRVDFTVIVPLPDRQYMGRGGELVPRRRATNPDTLTSFDCAEIFSTCFDTLDVALAGVCYGIRRNWGGRTGSHGVLYTSVAGDIESILLSMLWMRNFPISLIEFSILRSRDDLGQCYIVTPIDASLYEWSVIRIRPPSHLEG